ncbi:MAG: hypothetical protein ACKVWV_01490 [Planctomycetota bacterium]
MTPLFLLAWAQAPAKPIDVKDLAVPLGAAIDLDGKIGDEEWKGALRLPLEGGGALFVRHDAKNVYVGLRGERQGWAHVYVKRGDEVVVRHASASLGTAIYAKSEGGKWQPKQGFPAAGGEWALRETTLTPEVRALREKFLAREGWVATNNNMGKTEIELVLARKDLGERPVLAFAFVCDPTKPLLFPPTLSDGCTSAELLMGNTPSELDFRTDTWSRLRFTADAQSTATPSK